MLINIRLSQSKPIAGISVLWMILVIVILSFPNNPGPDAASMNYTCLLMFGYMFICLGYYYVPVYGGKYWFKGPVRNVDTVSYVSDEGSEKEKEWSKGSV